MGTSSSHSGPKGPSKLLPDWAQGDGSPFPDEEGESDDNNQKNDDSKKDSDKPVELKNSRSTMTRWINSGGSSSGLGGSGGAGGVARSYVSGRGGPRGAATSAVSGRRATASLGDFLSTVANRGAQNAAEIFGVAKFLGESAETMITALANVLAPEGNTIEEAAARRAIDDSLLHLYESLELNDGSLDAIESMDEAMVQETLQVSVESYIFHRWLQDLGDRIEKKAVSPKEAVRLEREICQYVREAVKTDFGEIDMLSIDWKSFETQQMIDGIYREAYELLGCYK